MGYVPPGNEVMRIRAGDCGGDCWKGDKQSWDTCPLLITSDGILDWKKRVDGSDVGFVSSLHRQVEL